MELLGSIFCTPILQIRPEPHQGSTFHSLFVQCTVETQKLCPENEKNPVYNTFTYGIKKNEKRSIILLIGEHPYIT